MNYIIIAVLIIVGATGCVIVGAISPAEHFILCVLALIYVNTAERL